MEIIETDARGTPLKGVRNVLAPALNGIGSESTELVEAGISSSKVRYRTGEEKRQPNNQIFVLRGNVVNVRWSMVKVGDLLDVHVGRGEAFEKMEVREIFKNEEGEVIGVFLSSQEDGIWKYQINPSTGEMMPMQSCQQQ